MSAGERDSSAKLLRAMRSGRPSEGFSHGFYQYPARFSPDFARAVIEAFTDPGELVLDPFMGSGTTLIEAMMLGRQAVGSDINPLAHFLAVTKTTVLSESDCAEIRAWCASLPPRLHLWRLVPRDHDWANSGYQKGVPWPLRKTIEQILDEAKSLNTAPQNRLVRCALLRTGQWALDWKASFPSASDFRDYFFNMMMYCLDAMDSMRKEISENEHLGSFLPICLRTSAAELRKEHWDERTKEAPKLILTSPPYPSVHVLYHRWQLRGRKETPVPFWIAGERDGKGASFYTMGSRTEYGLVNYFKSIKESFANVCGLIDDDAHVVQLMAFSDLERQLPRYLEAMNQAGYDEVSIGPADSSGESRLWRNVPLRRWYASSKGHTDASREILLVHQKRTGTREMPR